MENKILILDDEDFIPLLIERIAKGKEYSTLRARNGKEGIDKYEVNIKDIFYVLSDNNMPIMNGLKATSKIREIAEKHGKKPKISLMSGLLSEEEVLKYEHINKFYKKPFDINEILEDFDETYKSQNSDK